MDLFDQAPPPEGPVEYVICDGLPPRWNGKRQIRSVPSRIYRFHPKKFRGDDCLVITWREPAIGMELRLGVIGGYHATQEEALAAMERIEEVRCADH